MPRFSPGLDSEDRLFTKLEGFGCQLNRSEFADHEHKVDFTVHLLPECSRLLKEPLGVQVTTRIGDNEKRTKFLERVAKNPYAPRNIYVELDSDLDLDKGGAFLVLVAITNFLSNIRMKDIKVVGVQISTDLTYKFFDLNAPPIPLRTNGHMTATASGPSGEIDHYDPAKGFGFINTSDGTTFFFHINNVREKLAAFLSCHGTSTANGNGTDPRIKVRFVDMGQTVGKKYRQAKDIYRID